MCARAFCFPLPFPSVPRELFSIVALSQSSVTDVSSAVAAGDLDTAFAGAQPVSSAVAAPAPLAAPVQNASEGVQADLRFLLEDGNVGAAFIDSLEVNGILAVQEFAGLERDRTHMPDVLNDAFGLPSSSIQDPSLHSRMLHVWEVSNERVAERLLVASQHKAHGEILEMRQSDFLVYVKALNSAKGLVVVDERVLGRTLLEAIRWRKESCTLTSSPTSSRGLTKTSNDEPKERNRILASART